MKSSYNPSEEIDELRRTLEELRTKTDAQEALIASMNSRLDKLESLLSEAAKSVRRLESDARLATKNAFERVGDKRNLGNTIRSISDITKRGKS